MRWKVWIAAVLSIVLLTGCATTTSECHWTEDILFGGEETVTWLADNDPELLRDIVTHNDTKRKVCS